MSILPPARTTNRSGLADWVEIIALTSPQRFISSSHVRSLLSMESDGDDHGNETDPITGELLDTEILESEFNLKIEQLHEEIQYRSRLCPDNYPFELKYDSGQGSFSGSFRVESKFDYESPNFQYLFYVLCLLETGIRDKIIEARDVRATHHNLGLLFQVASCLALGCYIRGNSVWFGFPRPDKTNFLTALRNAFLRYGCHEVINKIPPGFPSDLKDAGIDIIAWIDFKDARGAKSIICGQVASGYDWKSKSLLGFMCKFVNWFTPPPPAHLRPAILIPFPIHHDLKENELANWEVDASNSMLYLASDFGVIFDRFRVASFAAQALHLSEGQKKIIDGFDQVQNVENWVRNLIAELVPA